jgi:hypothetical protein
MIQYHNVEFSDSPKQPAPFARARVGGRFAADIALKVGGFRSGIIVLKWELNVSPRLLEVL